MKKQGGAVRIGAGCTTLITLSDIWVVFDFSYLDVDPGVVELEVPLPLLVSLELPELPLVPPELPLVDPLEPGVLVSLLLPLVPLVLPPLVPPVLLPGVLLVLPLVPAPGVVAELPLDPPGVLLAPGAPLGAALPGVLSVDAPGVLPVVPAAPLALPAVPPPAVPASPALDVEAGGVVPPAPLVVPPAVPAVELLLVPPVLPAPALPASFLSHAPRVKVARSAASNTEYFIGIPLRKYSCKLGLG